MLWAAFSLPRMPRASIIAPGVIYIARTATTIGVFARTANKRFTAHQTNDREGGLGLSETLAHSNAAAASAPANQYQ